MAPEPALPKRKPRENAHIFNLGVQGRWVDVDLNHVLRLIYH